jgi:hypothetical protein
MERDLDSGSKLVVDYLAGVSSTRYSVEEYKYTWRNTEVFPVSPEAMEKLVLSEDAPYCWARSWRANNDFLVQEKKIPKPVPEDAFWGAKVQQKVLLRLAGKAPSSKEH